EKLGMLILEYLDEEFLLGPLELEQVLDQVGQQDRGGQYQDERDYLDKKPGEAVGPALFEGAQKDRPKDEADAEEHQAEVQHEKEGQGEQHHQRLHLVLPGRFREIVGNVVRACRI